MPVQAPTVPPSTPSPLSPSTGPLDPSPGCTTGCRRCWRIGERVEAEGFKSVECLVEYEGIRGRRGSCLGFRGLCHPRLVTSGCVLLADRQAAEEWILGGGGGGIMGDRPTTGASGVEGATKGRSSHQQEGAMQEQEDTPPAAIITSPPHWRRPPPPPPPTSVPDLLQRLSDGAPNRLG